MFLGREKELAQLTEQLQLEGKQAVLLYGMRRVGKSTLALEALRALSVKTIYYECLLTSLEKNLAGLTEKIRETYRNKFLHFASLAEAFEFLGAAGEPVVIVLDEYQYLKQVADGRYVDSLFQSIIDQLQPNIRLVLLGSYVGIMQELLAKENPLFGRFSLVLHLQPFDYYDSARFYPRCSVRDKVALYSIFGGLPFAAALLRPEETPAQNVKRLLLSASSPLRIYLENILLAELTKVANANMILAALANGKKRYGEIESAIGANSNGGLDKQLKNLLEMEIIRRVYPVNKPADKRKTFYEITDNLVRFYYNYVYGHTDVIARIGENAYYQLYIEKSLLTFIAHRFEEIVREYFMRQVKEGRLQEVYDVGTFWYDQPKEHRSGEFDCVLKHQAAYSFFEVKYHERPLSLQDVQQELDQLHSLPAAIKVQGIGFVSLAGFAFQSESLQLLAAEELYLM